MSVNVIVISLWSYITLWSDKPVWQTEQKSPFNLCSARLIHINVQHLHHKILIWVIIISIQVIKMQKNIFLLSKLILVLIYIYIQRKMNLFRGQTYLSTFNRVYKTFSLFFWGGGLMGKKTHWFCTLSSFNPFFGIIFMANDPFEKYCFIHLLGRGYEKVCFVHSIKCWQFWMAPYIITSIYVERNSLISSIVFYIIREKQGLVIIQFYAQIKPAIGL